MEQLVAYLLTAMLAWAPPKIQPEGESARARYASIAQDIAEVVTDSSEPPLYPGEDGRTKTALMLAALAVAESRLAADVDDGTCRRWSCDAGKAFSLWQIHPEDGIALVGNGFTYARNNPAAPVSSGSDLIRDRKLAVRVALHMGRQSGWRLWTTANAARGYVMAWMAKRPSP